MKEVVVITGSSSDSMPGDVPKRRYVLLAVMQKNIFENKTYVTDYINIYINPLNPELNPTCYLLELLLAHHFLHVSRIRVRLLTFRLLMSYIYMEHPFLMFLGHTHRRSTVGRTPLDE